MSLYQITFKENKKVMYFKKEYLKPVLFSEFVETNNFQTVAKAEKDLLSIGSLENNQVLLRII